MHKRYNKNTNGCRRWYVSLLEITLPPIKTGKKWDSLYVCCDACALLCKGEAYKPFLASLSVGEVRRNNFVRLASSQPISLRVNTLSELSVKICGRVGQTLDELDVKNSDLTTKCTFSLEWSPNTSLLKP